jgi:hypothetical protein
MNLGPDLYYKTFYGHLSSLLVPLVTSQLSVILFIYLYLTMFFPFSASIFLSHSLHFFLSPYLSLS